MDSIRISKVQDVVCIRRGGTATGTLHLTAHHLIFCPTKDASQSGPDTLSKPEMDEVWIPYPLINLVTRHPLTIQGHAPLNVQTRIFTSYTFQFSADSDALDVFESVKGLTAVTTITQLYAFFYSPSPPLLHASATDPKPGWRIYNPREEFARMGVGSRTRGWRFTDLNKDYNLSPTYPALLCVPTRISDATLTYGSKYRSKGRLPALAYLHWNLGTITRCSQPMIGLTNNRSVQDEKLVEAIFNSHHVSNTRLGHTGNDLSSAQSSPKDSPQSHIYGSTPSCLIIDARPTANAFANAAKGGGTENMEYYKDGKKAYIALDNIHVMRDSLNKVWLTLREGEILEETGGGLGANIEVSGGGGWIDRSSLRRAGWLRHIVTMIEGARLLVRAVHVQAGHVLIHCSDGWDRTSQLSGLTQVCLDPYYRTMKGFAVLIEKDWVSFGHMFGHRCGHLSREKMFLSPPAAPGGGAEFLATVQTKLGGGQQHLKETSPIFHQFLEATWNVLQQFPDRFEFNEDFLKEIFYHVYSCQFGTFLFDCERERTESLSTPEGSRLISIWDYLLSDGQRPKFTNPTYDPALDDHARKDDNGRYGDMGVLLPDPKVTKFWAKLYGRDDLEMNSRASQFSKPIPDVDVVDAVQGQGDELVLSAVEPPASPRLGLQRPVSTPPTPSDKSTAQSTPGRLTPAPNFLSQSVSGAFAAITRSSPSPSPVREPPIIPTHPKEQSFRPIENDSAFTMRTQNMVEPAPGSSSTSMPAVRRDVPPSQALDNRVKSMWGKFSSNATAAFSAVQGAYDGVANEFKGLNLQGRSLNENERELAQSMASTSTRFSDVPASPTASRHSTLPRSGVRVPSGQHTLPPEDNPWATTAQRRAQRPGLDELSFDSPTARGRTISTGAGSDPQRPPPPNTQQSGNDLPFDPTVMSVASNPWSSNQPRATQSRLPSRIGSKTNETAPLSEPNSKDAFDPLGVGGL